MAHEATLVHGDLVPENLLVDVERAEVTGLLDWELAHAGARLADLGNLLRFPPDEDDDAGRAFLVGVVELAEAGGLPAGWLDTARALDLFALVDLAARERADPVVEQAGACSWPRRGRDRSPRAGRTHGRRSPRVDPPDAPARTLAGALWACATSRMSRLSLGMSIVQLTRRPGPGLPGTSIGPLALRPGNPADPSQTDDICPQRSHPTT